MTLIISPNFQTIDLMVSEWATQHREELMENWVLVTKKDHQSFKPIKPLVE